MGQINTTVGDLDGNTRKIIDYIDQARSLKADLITFPELVITGYPPEDLLLYPQFIKDNLAKMHQVVAASRGIATVVGFVDGASGIHNAAAVAYDGELVGIYHKIHLPNYGVFDEERYFRPGKQCPVYVINGTSVGVNICEDIWHTSGPTAVQKAAGAEVIVNINGSPFHIGKQQTREAMLAKRAIENRIFVSYTNLVGGQDELVFDGASVIFNPTGDIVSRGKQFNEELIVADLDIESSQEPRPPVNNSIQDPMRPSDGLCSSTTTKVSAFSPASSPLLPIFKPTLLPDLAQVYEALVLGTRDYVLKTGFKKILVALSGGIDSSLVATVGVDALGADNVVGLSMPSRYSSEGSILDAMALATNLGFELRSLPIEGIFSAYLGTLRPEFDEKTSDLAEQNIQSRIRGNLIMAMSNNLGWLVLTTGNKSEMAVGYATIYGDMAGGFAVIKDVPKIMVYELCGYRNSLENKPMIPINVLKKPPSAELKPDQKDDDTLPPYAILDPILKAYIEEVHSFNDIVDMGFDKGIVQEIISMVDRNEYKRRQAPPGIKITPRSFGRDRRMPISNRYKPF
jgi:NAD+ synthase (glutamine-hydrolysing)